jgi:hypothetical protein
MINNISIIEAQEMIKQLQEKIDYLKNTQRKY